MVSQIANMSSKEDLNCQILTPQLSDLEFQVTGRDITFPGQVVGSILESPRLP